MESLSLTTPRYGHDSEKMGNSKKQNQFYILRDNLTSDPLELIMVENYATLLTNVQIIQKCFKFRRNYAKFLKI